MKFVFWLLINEAEISKHLHYFIRTSETRELLTGVWSGESKKALAFLLEPLMWQGWRDSNSQHADLESAALPIGATPL